MIKSTLAFTFLLFSPLVANDSLYGKQGHDFFMANQDHAVETVYHGCIAKDPLSNIIDQLAQIRHSIATQAKTLKADDFRKKRSGEKALGNSTPLNSKPYRWLRSQIQEHVTTLLTAPDTWQETSTGQYRLRILSPDQWPDLDKAPASIMTAMSNLNTLSQIETWDSSLTTGFEIYYFPGFKNRGSFNIPDFVDLSQPMNPMNFIDESSMKLLTQDPSMQIFILETQQKLKDSYLPSSWFFGTLNNFEKDPQASIKNSYIHLAHSARCTIGLYMDHIESLWQTLLSGDHKTTDELTTRLAKFNYFWSLAMPRVRGSAALGEWLSQGIAKYMGYTLSLKPDTWPNVDQAVFAHLDLDTFTQTYASTLEINLIKQDPPPQTTSHAGVAMP